jgi:hypothetical protein
MTMTTEEREAVETARCWFVEAADEGGPLTGSDRFSAFGAVPVLLALVDRLTTPAPPATPAGDTDALISVARTVCSPMVSANEGNFRALQKHCADLADALAEAKQDTARLDWLDTQRWEAGDRDGNNPPDYCQWDVQGQTWDVRSAIDAARRGAQEGDTDA